MDEDTDEEPTPELPDPVELVSPALAETLQGVTAAELAEVRTLLTHDPKLGGTPIRMLSARWLLEYFQAAGNEAKQRRERELFDRVPLSRYANGGFARGDFASARAALESEEVPWAAPRESPRESRCESRRESPRELSRSLGFCFSARVSPVSLVAMWMGERRMGEERYGL